MSEPTSITEADMAAIRADGDLKAFMADIRKTATERCAHRRALVHRHPDLVERLDKIPGQKAWTGYIAPELHQGAPNTSPIRAALLDLVTEAERREATAHRAAA